MRTLFIIGLLCCLVVSGGQIQAKSACRKKTGDRIRSSRHQCPILSRLLPGYNHHSQSTQGTIIDAHVIIIKGTDQRENQSGDTIRKCIEIGVNNVEEMLLLTPYYGNLASKAETVKPKLISQHRASKYRSFKVLEGKEVAPEAILSYIEKLHVRQNEAVLIYAIAHGALIDNNHAIFPDDSKVPLFRKDLMAVLREKNPRLGILISESCSTTIRSLPLGMDLAIALPSAIEGMPVPKPKIDWLWSRMDILLSYGNGFYDLNSTSPEEMAAPNTDNKFPFNFAFTASGAVTTEGTSGRVAPRLDSVALREVDLVKLQGDSLKPSQTLASPQNDNIKIDPKAISTTKPSDVGEFISDTTHFAIYTVCDWVAKGKLDINRNAQNPMVYEPKELGEMIVDEAAIAYEKYQRGNVGNDGKISGFDIPDQSTGDQDDNSSAEMNK